MAKPTPRHEDEWYLCGATPEMAAEQLQWKIEALTRRIARSQIELANKHQSLKALRAGEWPKDDNGLLTLSEDNPVQL